MSIEYKEFHSPVFNYTLIAIICNTDKPKQEQAYKEKLKECGFTKEQANESVHILHNSSGLAIPLDGPYTIIAINRRHCKSKTTEDRVWSTRTAAHECWHFLANVLEVIGEHSKYMDSEVNIKIFEWAFTSLMSMDFFTKKILNK